MNELRSKIIETMLKMNSNPEWKEGSDWTRGYQAGMIGAFDMILDWIRTGEYKDGRS